MNKSLRDALNKIESHEFAAEVNVASDLSTVRRIIQANQTIKKLRRMCEENASTIKEVLENVRRLAACAVDPRYESRWDVALTVYLVLLQGVDERCALLAATMVLRAPQTWWAGRMALGTLDRSSRKQRINTHDLTTLPSFDVEGPHQARFERYPRLVSTLSNASESVALFSLPSEAIPWPIEPAVVIRRNNGEPNPVQLFNTRPPLSGEWENVLGSGYQESTDTQDALDKPPVEFSGVSSK